MLKRGDVEAVEEWTESLVFLTDRQWCSGRIHPSLIPSDPVVGAKVQQPSRRKRDVINNAVVLLMNELLRLRFAVCVRDKRRQIRLNLSVSSVLSVTHSTVQSLGL